MTPEQKTMRARELLHMARNELAEALPFHACQTLETARRLAEGGWDAGLTIAIGKLESAAQIAREAALRHAKKYGVIDTSILEIHP